MALKSSRPTKNSDGSSERVTQGGLPVKNTTMVNELRDVMSSLVRRSEKLDARVWLDGVYTELEDALVLRNWVVDREVYFKIEGTISPTEKEDIPDGTAES